MFRYRLTQIYKVLIHFMHSCFVSSQVTDMRKQSEFAAAKSGASDSCHSRSEQWTFCRYIDRTLRRTRQLTRLRGHATQTRIPDAYFGGSDWLARCGHDRPDITEEMRVSCLQMIASF